ncbi:MAG TPA: HPF/RaiA family ribosome-associated protein [Candidatus Paceibacterota bacterium]|jgi:ribosome-associated translation inhibitor RaiA
MNTQFKNTHGGLSSALQERIERKLAKLSKLTDTKDNTANAFFELERSVGSHQSGEVWQATVNIDANGTRFHTSELAETPEKASDRALKEIDIELKKAKGKRQALVRRGGGIWKAFQQRFSRTG